MTSESVPRAALKWRVHCPGSFRRRRCRHRLSRKDTLRTLRILTSKAIACH